MHFESDTVKNDCPVLIFRKMMKYLKITFIYNTSLTVFLEKKKKSSEKKKKNLRKKSSENDQSTDHFQSFFILFFFSSPPTLDLKKNPVNQLIKKTWPNCS